MQPELALAAMSEENPSGLAVAEGDHLFCSGMKWREK